MGGSQDIWSALQKCSRIALQLRETITDMHALSEVTVLPTSDCFSEVMAHRQVTEQWSVLTKTKAKNTKLRKKASMAFLPTDRAPFSVAFYDTDYMLLGGENPACLHLLVRTN